MSLWSQSPVSSLSKEHDVHFVNDGPFRIKWTIKQGMVLGGLTVNWQVAAATRTLYGISTSLLHIANTVTSVRWCWKNNNMAIGRIPRWRQQTRGFITAVYKPMADVTMTMSTSYKPSMASTQSPHPPWNRESFFSLKNMYWTLWSRLFKRLVAFLVGARWGFVIQHWTTVFFYLFYKTTKKINIFSD